MVTSASAHLSVLGPTADGVAVLLEIVGVVSRVQWRLGGGPLLDLPVDPVQTIHVPLNDGDRQTVAVYINGAVAHAKDAVTVERPPSWGHLSDADVLSALPADLTVGAT